MANEVLQSIKQDIEKINSSIEEAKNLIGAMAEAGEETGQLEQQLRQLEIRKNRWERMLQARGV